MKLKNKKTGEIATLTLSTNGEDMIIMGNDMYAHITKLSELKDYEDYEEPKDFWFIDADGEARETTHLSNNDKSSLRNFGNYFNTLEEAEKAVECLRAWKRLSSLSFKFKGWRTADLGADKYYFVITAESDGAGKGDLDLLFSGEDD